MAYTLSFSIDIGIAGLTLKAALFNQGTIHATFRDNVTTFYADGQGGYQFYTAAIPSGYRGEIVFYTGTIGVGTDFSATTIYARGSVNPEEAEDIGLILAGLGSSGVGAFAVTVTVVDGSAVPLQNVHVRLTNGINSFVAISNSGGVATFALDAATYVRTATKDGYTMTPDSIIVTAAGNFGLVMTQNVAPSPPADADLCTVYGYIINVEGQPAKGVKVVFTLVATPPTNPPITSGTSIVSVRQDTAFTDNSGYVSISLIRTDALDDTCTYTILSDNGEINSTGVTLTTATKDLSTL